MATGENLAFFVAANMVKYVKFYGCEQCCGSVMFIPDPGAHILIFTHPGSRFPDRRSATLPGYIQPPEMMQVP
jgi:hypothetical protein